MRCFSLPSLSRFRRLGRLWKWKADRRGTLANSSSRPISRYTKKMTVREISPWYSHFDTNCFHSKRCTCQRFLKMYTNSFKTWNSQVKIADNNGFYFRKIRSLGRETMHVTEMVKSSKKVEEQFSCLSSMLARASLMEKLLGVFIVIKALANEDTLLRTHCCRHKCFPVCPRT